MADNTNAGPGDTLEFLKLMGMGASEAPATGAPSDGAPDASDATFSDMPPLAPAPTGNSKARGRRSRVGSPDGASGEAGEPAPQEGAAGGSRPREARSVVIKGGPRRVVRADGRQPETSLALGQQRFSLSSGHAMFTPKKERNIVLETLIALAALLALAAIFVAVWFATQASITHDEQEQVVGTTAYDSALSLTPADDGTYYTAYFVTSTPTDEQQIGELSQIMLYRYDKDITTALRIDVPTNLYIALSSGGVTEAHTAQEVLASQSITRVLSGIEDAFGIRLYNVVCCQQSVFDELYAIMTGATDPASVDPSSLLGSVRSNLTLEGLVELCGRFGDLDQAGSGQISAPVAGLDVNGVVMAQGSAPLLKMALLSVSDIPGNAQLDAKGFLAGTQYDEEGNPLLDASGAPSGALRDENNNLVFDENGVLQFYGQQYDANGMPVGTIYDEWGNALLDAYGNPQGTQYDEAGNILYDWRGNMVIQN